MNHPLPWRVEYRRLYPEWHPRACPHVVDADGGVVCSVPQNVPDPREYDKAADDTASAIVASVNFTGFDFQ